MEKLEIVDRLRGAVRERGRAELVIVTGTQGSSPRSAGAWMAALPDGAFAGTVGGGKVEELAQREAAELLSSRCSRAVRYTMGGPSSDTGMICGGSIDLLYLYMDATSLSVLDEAGEVLRTRGEGALVVDASPLGEPAPDAPAHGAGSARTCTGPLGIRIERPVGPGAPVAGMAGGVYVEPLCPEGLAYIFGCGHVGRALASALFAAGFAVVACDDRPEMLAPELVPHAADRRLVDYADLSATCPIGPRDLVVSATAGHASDYEVVSQAMAAHPSYLGCLGSRRKTAFVRARLGEDGFPPEEVERLHMPVGLPIHAETPEEIAVSIAAEMIAHRRTAIVPRPH